MTPHLAETHNINLLEKRAPVDCQMERVLSDHVIGLPDRARRTRRKTDTKRRNKCTRHQRDEMRSLEPRMTRGPDHTSSITGWPFNCGLFSVFLSYRLRCALSLVIAKSSAVQEADFWLRLEAIWD